MRARVLALLVAALSLVAVAIAPNAGAQGEEVRPCNGDGQVHASPRSFWPPNHRMHTVTLAFTEQEFDGDTLAIEVLSITNDELGREKGKMLADNPDGSGVGNSGTGIDHSPDSPYAITTADVRAERLGRDKGGRVYTITVKCTDEGDVSGNPPRSDTVDMTVKIPHNH